MNNKMIDKTYLVASILKFKKLYFNIDYTTDEEIEFIKDKVEEFFLLNKYSSRFNNTIDFTKFDSLTKTGDNIKLKENIKIEDIERECLYSLHIDQVGKEYMTLFATKTMYKFILEYNKSILEEKNTKPLVKSLNNKK